MNSSVMVKHEDYAKQWKDGWNLHVKRKRFTKCKSSALRDTSHNYYPCIKNNITSSGHCTFRIYINLVKLLSICGPGLYSCYEDHLITHCDVNLIDFNCSCTEYSVVGTHWNVASVQIRYGCTLCLTSKRICWGICCYKYHLRIFAFDFERKLLTAEMLLF